MECAKLSSNASAIQSHRDTLTLVLELPAFVLVLTNMRVAQWQYMKQGGKISTQNKIGCKT